MTEENYQQKHQGFKKVFTFSSSSFAKPMDFPSLDCRTETVWLEYREEILHQLVHTKSYEK